MFTIHIEIDGEKRIVQVKNLLDVDTVILSSIVNFMEEHINSFKNFANNYLTTLNNIRLRDYNKYLNSVGKEQSSIEIYHIGKDQIKMYTDVDYWINYVYQNSCK